MKEFPFNIPKSLATYIEQFNDDPLNVTTKLKKQLRQRGPDAIGYFLLAWFYHVKGIEKQAVANALKAKAYAPGSPLMEKLHYYLSHPAAFEAWTPRPSTVQSSQKYRGHNGPEPVLDLDNLIAKLSEVDSEPITMPETEAEKEDFDHARAEDDIDDIASETLAKIHEQQGKLKAAINTYRRLQNLDEKNSSYYGEQIARLEKTLKEDRDDEKEQQD